MAAIRSLVGNRGALSRLTRGRGGGGGNQPLSPGKPAPPPLPEWWQKSFNPQYGGNQLGMPPMGPQQPRTPLVNNQQYSYAPSMPQVRQIQPVNMEAMDMIYPYDPRNPNDPRQPVRGSDTYNQQAWAMGVAQNRMVQDWINRANGQSLQAANKVTSNVVPSDFRSKGYGVVSQWDNLRPENVRPAGFGNPQKLNNYGYGGWGDYDYGGGGGYSASARSSNWVSGLASWRI